MVVSLPLHLNLKKILINKMKYIGVLNVIVKRLNFEDFKREFIRYDRENQFSEDGLMEVYESISGYQNKVEVIDVIGICTEYSELTPNEYQDYQDQSFIIKKLINGNILIKH